MALTVKQSLVILKLFDIRGANNNYSGTNQGQSLNLFIFTAFIYLGRLEMY